MGKIRTSLLSILMIFLAFGLWAGGQQASEPASDKQIEGLNSNPLSDYRVRQAIAYAIDMDTIAETLLEGKALVSNSMVPNGPWKADGLNSYSYDPEMAKSLLKEAGWDSSYTLDVVYYYGDQLTVDIMTAVQAYLGGVGIKMDFRKLEGDLGEQLWTNPSDPVNGPSYVKWDMAYAGSAALAMHEYYGKLPTNGPGNSHTPSNPTIDKLVAATKATANIVEQQKAFFALEEYVNEYLPLIPLYYQQLFIYESDRVNRNGGAYGNAQYNYDWGILDWTVEADSNGKHVLYTNTAPVEFFEHPWFNPGLNMANKVLFDRLIVADESLMAKEGQLASSFKVSDDSMEIEFTLEDGAKWHDGSAITADDIKWSIEYALKVPAIHSVFSTTFKSIEGADAYVSGTADSISGIAVNGNKVKVTFATLDPNMLLTFSQFPPLPKKYFENSDPLQFQQNSFWQSPVGSGPFKIKTVEMNDYTVAVPFESYYGGTAKIDEIVMYPSGENDTNVIKNASAGKLDYGFTKSVADVKALEAMENMRVIPVDIPYTRLFYVNKFPKP
ncbi:ABC transporter substrate-binding protein [Spirochaeta isovalerica]|uniref:Peptide/nickel transport system substrate-binding protein n=1 Tax=Spirochaeta isovalerica TaxID=150 RepID=A0A841R7Y2_9SPIO|nr:ABC transporter substrate-binding protein [Spirochaeta isovalerica]MBB6479973.1 peptide/nickel transport system substrate-binding protein [Spirochaeta isovalerica]